MLDDSMLDEFRVEAAEMFEEAEAGLLNIDRGEDFSENYNLIFRAFHSLKGAAGMFGLEALQGHMHKLENLFEQIKSHGEIPKAMVDYLLDGVDAARSILDGEEVSFVHQDLSDFTGEEVAQATEEVSVEQAPVEEVATPVQEAEPHRHEAPEKFDYQEGLVYIVDDEPEICEVISEILESENFVTKSFTSGKDLLKSLEERTPEAILSDINMPELSGVELLSEVHKQDHEIPVLFISAFVTKEIMLEALNYGAYGFIEKPFENVMIISSTRNAVKKSRASKLLNKSIDYILYQFSDLDAYLEKEGKDSIRMALKKDLEIILEQKKLLKKLG